MRSGYVIGSISGILLTVALWHVLKSQNLIKSPNSPGPVVPALVEKAAAPPLYAGFETQFDGSDDLLAHRARLAPNMKTEDWDRLLPKDAAANNSNCSPETVALTISAEETMAVAAGKVNVLFLPHESTLCLKTGKPLQLVSPDSSITVTVERFATYATTKVPPDLLKVMGLKGDDVPYLMNRQMLSEHAGKDVVVILIKTASST